MSYKQFSARQDAIASAQTPTAAKDVPAAPSKESAPPNEKPSAKPGNAPAEVAPPPKS